MRPLCRNRGRHAVGQKACLMRHGFAIQLDVVDLERTVKAYVDDRALVAGVRVSDGARPTGPGAPAIASLRSKLAERFRALIGEPPMHYLTRLRMQLAARRLEASHHSVARVADEVGYESSAAFQRAFKRCFGVPPATWRRQSTTPARDPLQPAT